MKKIILSAVSVAAALALAGCGAAIPNAGEEAVLVKKPYFFGHGGVADEPITTGRTFVAWSTDVITVPVVPVQWDVPFDDLMSKDGVPLHFDAVARLQVVDSVRLIKHFGPDWFKNNMDAEIRNRVRQAVRKHGMNETAIDTVAIDSIDAEVTKAINDYIARTKLPVKLIKFTVGKANPPDMIKNQRVASAREEQRQKTEVQTQIAEVARKEAEKARAEADNAYRQQMSLSPEQFVKLQEIDMIRQVCAEGKCTFINGNGTALVGSK